jgi:hypothetical protein
MGDHIPRLKQWHPATGLAMLIAFALLVGCGTTENSNTNVVAIHSPSAAATIGDPTQTNISRRAYETQVAQARASFSTQIAARPTRTPGPPPPTHTAEPQPTLEIGFSGCSNANTHIPQQFSCWRGIVNGELLSVASGREGTFGDQSQGLIMINHGSDFDPMSPNTEIYSTPLKLGTMRIVKVEGTLFTLIPIDMRTPGVLLTPRSLPTAGPILVFDLATRQWLTQTQTPGPLSSPSPLPTTLP